MYGKGYALAEALPPVFDLEVPALHKRFRVALRWRREGVAGVVFVAG